MTHRRKLHKSSKSGVKTTERRLTWFSARQAAEFLGLDTPTVTRLLDTKILPYTILPVSIRWRRIHRRDLVAYQRQLDARKGS